MTPHVVISASGVHRRYGSFEAVRGVDLEVRRGELVALLGTNGAGKTSLVECLQGLAAPSAGEIRVLGADPFHQRRQVIDRMGTILQAAGFSSDLTVAETCRMWAGTLSAPRAVADVLGAVGLTDRAGVRVGSLSGGERRRLDLALAIMGSLEVLFLDEPTTGLDPESRRATWDLVRSLLADGTSVLLTTHYLDEAEQLADRIAVMHAGRIVTAGTVGDIVASEPSRIAFVPRRPDGDAVPLGTGDLPPLAGSAVVNRSRVEVRTNALQADLESLLSWSRSRGLDLAELDARAASLEQAYFAIAGSPLAGEHPSLEELAA